MTATTILNGFVSTVYLPGYAIDRLFDNNSDVYLCNVDNRHNDDVFKYHTEALVETATHMLSIFVRIFYVSYREMCGIPVYFVF